MWGGKCRTRTMRMEKKHVGGRGREGEREDEGLEETTERGDLPSLGGAEMITFFEPPLK